MPKASRITADPVSMKSNLGKRPDRPGMWRMLSFLFVLHVFLSHFFSSVSQAGCLWEGSRLACLPLPFMCLPVLFICLPVLFICLPGWVLVGGFLAGLSPTSFHVSPSSFHLSPRLGACGRVSGWLVPGWLVSNLLSCVSHFLSFVSQAVPCSRVPGSLVSHLLSCVSQFFSFVSQAGCLWSGSRLACLPLPFICLSLLFICLPGWVLVGRFLAGLSPTSFHSPNSLLLGVLNALKNGRLGAGWSGRVGCLWAGSWLACLPLPFMCLPVLFICLPGWVLVVGLAAGLFPAGLSPTCFHVSPTSFHLSPRLFLVVGFRARLSPTCFHVSPNSFHLSPKLGACGRVPGWLVSHFLSFVSHFFSFVSQAGCLWAGSWLACLQLPFICLPLLSPNSLLLGVQWSPWCWMVWSGSRPACLPLPFICLPVLFICLPSSVLVVGFAAGLSPTSFHLSPTSFHLSPSSFHLSPRLGACGRVPGWLVSHFLSFVSHFFSFVFQFFSFVSQAGCLWSGSQLACLPLPFICLPLLFICLPLLFICLPVLFICLPGWVLVVGFPAGLSPTSFHMSPTSFHLSPSSFNLSPRLGACGRVSGWLVSHFLSFVSHFFSCVCQGGCLWCWLVSHFLSYLPLLFICLPGWVLVVRFPAGLSPTSFHLSRTSFHLSGWVLWSGLRLACLPRAFICLPLLSFVSQFFSFVSQFFSFLVSQAGCLWSGSRLACLALPFICLLLLFTCLLSFHLSPRLGACGQVPGRLVSHFLPHFFSFVSQFFSLSPRLGACGRGFAAGLSPTSFHLSPTSFHLSFHLSPTSFHLSPRLGACGRVSGWLVSHFLSYVSHFFSFVSLGACGRVCGWLVSHVLSFVSHFFHLSPSSFHLSPTSFQPACLPLPLSPSSFQSGFPAGLSPTSFHLPPNSFHLSPPLLPFICFPLLFIVSQAGCLWSGSGPACLPLLIICLPGWVLVVGFPPSLSPTSFHLSPTSFLLVVGFPARLSPTCFHLSPGSFHLSPRNASFVSQVRHCWCHVAFLFICLCHC